MKDACTCIPSGNECHCVKCCLNFSTEQNFEMHIGPGGIHRHPTEVVRGPRSKRVGESLLKPVQRIAPDREVWVGEGEAYVPS